MTTPTGHPDYQDYPITQSGNIFPAFTQNLAFGNTTTQVFAATNFQTLFLHVGFQTAHGTVQVNYFLDKNGAVSIDSDFYSLAAGMTLVKRLPLKGPYFSVTIRQAAAGVQTVFTWGILTAASIDRLTAPIGRQKVADTAHSLAASGTITYSFPVIVDGLSQMHFKPADTAGKLNVAVQEVNDAGAAQYTLWSATGPTAEVNQNVVLPDQPIVVVVTNTDAASAHTYDLALACPP